ncbi:MAG TPA: flagellar hook capping protein [Candidatus Adamsella sp.]|nr:flagellar hook capping protein [Candidatus Adamsella sp.]
MQSSSSIENTLTNIKNNTAKVNAENAKNNVGRTELDQNAFLQLLMVQLQNQDPMNPTDNQEFIAQQAQFTQVTELQKLNETLTASNSLLQASSLIGKEVTLIDPNNTSQRITGIVEGAIYTGQEAGITINGKNYPLGLIESIKEPGADTGTDNSAGGDGTESVADADNKENTEKV